MKKTIKIPKGNDFTLHFPVVVLTRTEPERIDAASLANIKVVVSLGCVNEDYAYIIDDGYICVDFPATLKVGTYHVAISAKYGLKDIQINLRECFEIVHWNIESNVQDHIKGSPYITDDCVFIGQICSDEELQAMKAQYRVLLQETEMARRAASEARDALADKAAALDDVARETTLNRSTTSILTAIEDNKMDSITEQDINDLF